MSTERTSTLECGCVITENFGHWHTQLCQACKDATFRVMVNQALQAIKKDNSDLL